MPILPVSFKRRLACVALIAIVLIATGCYFESPNSGGLYADVPYFAQEEYYLCTAACVQMVAKWSNVDVTQEDAFLFINGTPESGVHVGDLIRGLVEYTNLTDAYNDLGLNNDTLYFARQISSVSNKIPVICETDAGSHTVVLYGGSWHMTVDSNNHKTYYWDDVYFHDPSRGAGIRYTAGAWQGLHCTSFGNVCSQVISNSAAIAGPKTLADYDPTIYVTGGDGSAHGGGGGPYDY